MAIENQGDSNKIASPENGEQEKVKFIEEIIADVKSGRWKNMPERYVQTGQGTQPYLYEIDPREKYVCKGIVLGVDEQTGEAKNEVVEIVDWVKWEHYDNGQLKEVHAIRYNGNGTRTFESHKKYDQNGQLME